MTNWPIQENESVQEYLQRPEVNVGDTIEVISNNQLGYKKYKVILGENGNKSLRTLADWDEGIYETNNTDEESGMTDDEMDGGKKKRRRTKRRKSRKNKKSKKARKSRKNRRSRRY